MKTKQAVKKAKVVDISKLLTILENMRPFFEDSDNYMGIYEEDVKNLCKFLEWKCPKYMGEK